MNCSLMLIKLSAITEGLWTERTLEVELSCMCSLVLQHAFSAGEAFLTDVTWILVVTLMGQHMPLVTHVGPHHFATEVAHKLKTI